jgi:hypothetical protein
VHSSDINTIQDNALGIAQVLALSISNWNIAGSGTTIAYNGLPTVVIGGAVLSFPAANGLTVSVAAHSAWSYLYLYNNSGTLTWEQSATGPDINSGWTFKTGDPTRMYVTAFYVDGAGIMSPFMKVGHRYLYSRSSVSATGWPGHFILTAATFTTISPNAAVPPHVLNVDLYIQMSNNSSTTLLEVDLRVTGAATSYTPIILGQAPAGNLSSMAVSVPMILGSSHGFDYQLAVSAGSPSVTADVLGFWE